MLDYTLYKIKSSPFSTEVNPLHVRALYIYSAFGEIQKTGFSYKQNIYFKVSLNKYFLNFCSANVYLLSIIYPLSLFFLCGSDWILLKQKVDITLIISILTPVNDADIAQPKKAYSVIENSSEAVKKNDGSVKESSKLTSLYSTCKIINKIVFFDQ